MGFFPNEGDVDANGAEEVNLRNAAGAELLGQQVSAASLPVVVASDQTVPISAATLPLPTGAATDASITNGNLRGTVRVWDGADVIAVNTDGSVNVVPLLSPPAPSGTTPVVISAFGDASSTAGDDTYYTITNGFTLVIQTFVAGSEETTGGAVIELFYDPNADLTGMTRISTLFVNGESDNTPVGQEFIGNGTRRIVLRRRTYSASAREMFGQWIGYEE